MSALGRRRLFFMAVLALGGAAAGVVLQQLFGCSTGTCPITSSPAMSAVYGAFVSVLAFGGLVR